VPLPGIAKFFESGFTNDPSNAIELLCNNHILPHLEVAAVHQRNDFRRFRLYNQPVDDVLKRNKRTLEYMFRNCCCLKQSKDVCMDMKEWVSLLTHLGVIDNDFTKREARLCFCWSKMRVADEVKRELAWTTMTFFDFLEALCRVSELKSFPTDAQLEAGGYANVVQFFADPKHPPPDDNTDYSTGGLFADHGRSLAERVDKFLLQMFAAIDSSVVNTGKVDASKLFQIMNNS
jgi:hypothetical protein